MAESVEELEAKMLRLDQAIREALEFDDWPRYRNLVLQEELVGSRLAREISIAEAAR